MKIDWQQRHKIILGSMKGKFTVSIFKTIKKDRVAKISYSPEDEKEVLERLSNAGFKIDYRQLD